MYLYLCLALPSLEVEEALTRSQLSRQCSLAPREEDMVGEGGSASKNDNKGSYCTISHPKWDLEDIVIINIHPDWCSGLLFRLLEG